jgi:hypothetical protein
MTVDIRSQLGSVWDWEREDPERGAPWWKDGLGDVTVFKRKPYRRSWISEY